MKDYDIEIIHRGFEIHPEVPADGMPMKAYFPKIDEMSGQLRAMGKPYGLEFNSITIMPNTNKALQVGEYAKSVGKSYEFNKAMYKATFVEDINISLESEIIKIAVSIGMTEDGVTDALSTNTYKNILDENKTFCRDNNISSVPTFIVNDKFALVGAQGPDRFKDIFDKLEAGTEIL